MSRRTVARIWIVAAAAAAGLNVALAGQTPTRHRLNPVIDLLEQKKAVFGVYNPSNPNGRGRAGAPPPVPVTPKTQAPNEARVLSSAFSAVAKALRPSVIRIDVEIAAKVAQAQNEGGDDGSDDELAPFLRRFFQFGPGMPEPDQGPQRGTGSGVVIDARGDIVTNRHVVSGASTVKVMISAPLQASFCQSL